MLYIDKRNNIKITQGDSATINVDITDADGKPVEWKNGDKLHFSLYLPNTGVEKSSTDFTSPVINISATNTYLWGNESSLWLYDVDYKPAAGGWFTVASGILEIIQEWKNE